MGRKVKIELPEITTKEVEICGKTVKVEPIITLEKYEIILNDIKETVLYNEEVSDKLGIMHARTIRDVLELCTNIDISGFEAENFNCSELSNFVYDNIDNIFTIEEYLEKEYDKYVMESCFGVLANKLPSTQDMEESMKRISETIENIPDDKLEMISKSIVWNNMPALGQQMAPATHINAIEGE